MSLNYEMAKYTELTGEDGTKVPISRLGGFLDGYEKGRADVLKELREKESKHIHDILPPVPTCKFFDIEKCYRDEHDKQIRNDAIEDYTEWLRKAHANFDEDYAEDIKSDYLDTLKESKE